MWDNDPQNDIPLVQKCMECGEFGEDEDRCPSCGTMFVVDDDCDSVEIVVSRDVLNREFGGI